MTNITSDHVLKAEFNLYYDLLAPDPSPGPLLIALHGYGANKRQMMREGQMMAPAGFAIASLQGFHQHMREPKETGGPPRFGFGWLTNFRSEESVAIHHKAMLDLIDNLVGEGVADPNRIFLLGFSQSCALNYRFAFTYPDHLRGIIGICGGIPGDWETNEAYQQTSADLFHLAGIRDEFYTPERIGNYEQQLGTRAHSVAFKRYDAGHEIVPDMRVDVKHWLAQYTNKEG
jgi:phospholipase/carboxylesterase